MSHLAPVIPALTSSNPGLPSQAPMRYTDYMILYSAEDCHAVVDGAPPGPLGRLFVVPAHKPVKVPWEAGRFMIEHMSHTGVVRVNEIENKNEDGDVVGTIFDIDTARMESEHLLKEQDDLRFRRYVSDTMDDYVARKDGKSKVPPPPPEPILRIIARRNYRLQDYGISPIGYVNPADQRARELENENKSLREQMNKLASQVELLASMQQRGQGQNKESEPESEQEDKSDADNPLSDVRPSDGQRTNRGRRSRS